MGRREPTSFEVEVDMRVGELTVSGFQTRDADVVEYFADVAAKERPRRFETSVKVGVVALKTIGTSERVDYVEKRFNMLRETFERKLDEVFGESGELERAVDMYFGDKGQVADLLEEHFGADGKIVKQVFDPSVPGTPLAVLKQDLENQLIDLRKDLGLSERVEEIEEATPIKGRKFEDAFEEILCGVARPLGDIVQRTTEKPGLLKGSKKGDFVVTLGDRPDVKLVFETKALGTTSMPAIEDEMKEALENRGADYGVFVARDLESLPRSVGWFNEYWGNVLVLALGEGGASPMEGEILRVGYRWARMRALASPAAALKGVDATQIQQQVMEAERTLKRFGQVRTQCTNARSAVEAIERELEGIQEQLEEAMERIASEVAKAQA